MTKKSTENEVFYPNAIPYSNPNFSDPDKRGGRGSGAGLSLPKPPVDADYDPPMFTPEQIAEMDAKERKRNADAMDEIKEAGFIRYPVFVKDMDGNLIEKEAWISPDFEPSCSEGFFEKHGMDFNIYIPSYERAGTKNTMEMLNSFNCDNWYACIDPSQFHKYRQHYPEKHLVIRDIGFREENMYERISSIEIPIQFAGHAPLTNFILAFSKSLGESHYWFMDDDFLGLAMKARKDLDSTLKNGDVYNKDDYYRCSEIKPEYGFDFQEFMHSIEKFTKKLRNPALVALEKFGLVFSLPVCYRYGTRAYSFYLATNRTQIPQIGRQNNDSVTSLAFGRQGYVVCLFEGIGYNSLQTQVDKGGQSVMYKKFGTLDKGKVLVRAEPNYAKISQRFNRIHHTSNYTNYAKQRLAGMPIKSED